MNFKENKNENKKIYGWKKYTEFFGNGNVNILISVAHDGQIEPKNITDRKKDLKGNLLGDDNTLLIANTIREELTSLFKLKENRTNVLPFMVVNNLKRKKMDPNREFGEACFDVNEESGKAYKDFHNMIENYFCRNFMLNSNYEQGLLLDIHGQTHKEQRIELGYLLSGADLNKANLDSNLINKSSIARLASLSNQKFEELIRGSSFSLGGIIQNKLNLNVIPSPDVPGPLNTQYYTGGFITSYYSSAEMSDYRLNCIQLELPSNFRHGSKDKITENAKHLAECIFEFYTKNSLNNLKSTNLKP